MLSIPDMALLGAAALMFFGPEQLPKVARKVGLLVRDVQNTSQSFIREMERAGDDTPYNPDISRAHLIEEASGVTPVPSAYVPPAHDPYLGEPYDVSAFAEHSDHVEHTEQIVEYEREHDHALNGSMAEAGGASEATPVLHDIVAPTAAHGALDHDLPP
jgi:Sec-independent protein translocase protein TatA